MWGVKKENDSIQCSLIRNPTVFIELMPRSKIQFLMEEYPHQEWLAYLQGKVSEKGNIFVEDISVPPHKEASGASAEAEPFHIPDDCVGIIHSHHTMGAFHSITDREYVDKNYPVSITVAKGSQELTYDAVSYQTTLCDKGVVVKCPVKYVSPQPPFDKDEFLKDARENIDKSKRVYPKFSQGRLSYPADYVIDGEGHVLSQRELDRIYKDIWGEE